MKLNKSHIIGIVIIAVTVLCVSYVLVSGKNKTGAKGVSKGGRGGGNTVVSVKTQLLAKTVLHDYVSTNGEVESQNSVSVFPDVAGKIVRTEVMLGSTVKKGDVVAWVDPSTPGSNYKISPVYAPISGSVISTPLKNGTTVGTSSTITQVGDINNLQVTADIPERYVSYLKIGLKADICVEAYPGVVFKATVSRVSPVVDSTSRTKQIVLVFDKKDSRVNAGMFAKVVLYIQDLSGYVTMPSSAIVSVNDVNYAYVVNADSTVSRREVKLGGNVDGMVQLLSGCSEGETVVVQGQTSLADGSRIQDITNGVSSQKKGEQSESPKGNGGKK